MAVIKVPKPPQSAVDKDRPVSALLRSQIEHLQEAEFRLPAKHQTNVYINAITTEGEAADYIRQVTSAIHQAHGRKAPVKKEKPGIALAAAVSPSVKKKKAGVSATKQRRRAKHKHRT
jgi:hypothetical protein